jgi:hypothetical protein
MRMDCGTCVMRMSWRRLERYISAVALATATGTEEGGRFPDRGSGEMFGQGAAGVPESGTVRRRGDGAGKRKYAFDASDALRTVARAASLWGRLGMTAE